jgi:hypothetical protein
MKAWPWTSVQLNGGLMHGIWLYPLFSPPDTTPSILVVIIKGWVLCGYESNWALFQREVEGYTGSPRGPGWVSDFISVR